ncbi:MAG: molybdate ABC transporter substrate-binding protein [Deltaproteobacteria bacterium]|nr:MAG: molybdate ABC transporter substrate-binding protein [Deltaproteobacteria bacterium]
MIALWWLLACGGGAERELTVLAAASLTDAYQDMALAFEQAHPGVDVVLSVAGSQTLATQIRHGIGADVFASANEAHIRAVADEGLVAAPRALARNALVLAVRSDTHPVEFAALDEVGSLVVGDTDVPVGRYTATLLDAAEQSYGEAWRAGVEARVVSREPSVRLVAAKVAMGEADAALVYATDARAVPGLRAIAVPATEQPPEYFHARLTDSTHPELAEAWLAFVESAEGQRILAEHGFDAP